MHAETTPILEKLRCGDLRSIGKCDEVVREVLDNPALFGSVFRGFANDEPVVRMRSADVIEKVTRSIPELLDGYTSEVISLLTSAEQLEVCWHLAQIASRVKYNSTQESKIFRLLKKYLLHKSKIVQVSAMESLAILAERNNSFGDEVIRIITAHGETGSPAVRERSLKLLQRLQKRQSYS